MADYNLTETGKGPCKEGQPITVMDQTKNKTQTNKQNKQKQNTDTLLQHRKKHTTGYLGIGLVLMFNLYTRRATGNRSRENCIKQILMRLHTEELR